MLRTLLAAAFRLRRRLGSRFQRLGDVRLLGRRLGRRKDGLGFVPVAPVLVVGAQSRVFLALEAALLDRADVRTCAAAAAAAAALANTEFIFFRLSVVRRVVRGRGVELEHGGILQRTNEILGWHRRPWLLGLVAGCDACKNKTCKGN